MDVVRAECLRPADEGWEPPTAGEVRAVLALAGLSGGAAARFLGHEREGRTRRIRRWAGGDEPIPYSAWALLCDRAGLGRIWEDTPELEILAAKILTGFTTLDSKRETTDIDDVAGQFAKVRTGDFPMALPQFPFAQADYDALAVALASEDRKAWFNLDQSARALYSMRAIRLLAAVNADRSHRPAA